MGEMRAEEIEEFPAIEFMDVELVKVTVPIGVHRLVGRGHDEYPVFFQHAVDLPQKPALQRLVDVLDGLEGHDRVHAVILQRDARGVPLPVLKIVPLILLPGPLDGLPVDIHAQHARGRFREKGGAVPLAAGDVQHVEALHQLPDAHVALQVLDLQLAVLDPGHEPLPGEPLRLRRLLAMDRHLRAVHAPEHRIAERAVEDLVRACDQYAVLRQQRVDMCRHLLIRFAEEQNDVEGQPVRRMLNGPGIPRGDTAVQRASLHRFAHPFRRVQRQYAPEPQQLQALRDALFPSAGILHQQMGDCRLPRRRAARIASVRG